MRTIFSLLLLFGFIPSTFAQYDLYDIAQYRENPYLNIVPYQDEASALTFSKEKNPFYADITDQFQIQTYTASTYKNTSYNKEIPLTASVQIPQIWQQKEKFIVFAAQQIEFHLLINGVQVAFIEKQTPAKLNITSFLNLGENRIELKMDQKQADTKGLLHEIILLATPKLPVVGYDIQQNYSHNPQKETNWTNSFYIKNYEDSPYKHKNTYTLKLYDQSLKIVKTHVFMPDTNTIKPLKPVQKNNTNRIGCTFFGTDYYKKWTAETPYLYAFTFQGTDSTEVLVEVVSGKTGFRVVRLAEDKLYLGNIPLSAPVTFKPVLYKAPASADSLRSREIMREQIRTLKIHHVNTLILSEYARSPLLYELCDEMGMYIIHKLKFPLPEPSAKLSADEKTKAIRKQWERAALILDALRHHPSIVAWQIDKNYDSKEIKGLNYSIDLERPVSFYKHTSFRHGASWDKSLPFIQKTIPDWNTLSAKQRTDLKKEYQSVHLSIRHQGDNTLYLSNKYDFTNLDNMALVWEIKENGKTVQQGEIEQITVLPKKELPFALPFKFEDYKTKSSYSFRFSLRLKESLPWAEKGYEIAGEEFAFKLVGNDIVLINTNKSSKE